MRHIRDALILLLSGITGMTSATVLVVLGMLVRLALRYKLLPLGSRKRGDEVEMECPREFVREGPRVRRGKEEEVERGRAQ